MVIFDHQKNLAAEKHNFLCTLYISIIAIQIALYRISAYTVLEE